MPSSILSGHSSIKLKVNSKQMSNKQTNTWRLSNSILYDESAKNKSIDLKVHGTKIIWKQPGNTTGTH